MKKNGILNSEISKVFSELRHMDYIVIGDCGLPVPEGVKEIDLSLRLGVPSFNDVLETILDDFKCEFAIIAHNTKENEKVYNKICELAKRDNFNVYNNYEYEGIIDLYSVSDNNIKEYLPNSTRDFWDITHKHFKLLSKGAKLIIRTGENTPYANIILVSGVVF